MHDQAPLSDDQLEALFAAADPEAVATVLAALIPATPPVAFVYQADADRQTAALPIEHLQGLLYQLRTEAPNWETAGVAAHDQPQHHAWRIFWVLARMIPTLLAPAMHIYGRAYNDSGEYQEAVLPTHTAIFAYQCAGDADGVARARTTLASAYYSLTDYRTAETLVASARAWFQRTPERYGFELATSGKLWADILADTQRAEEALREYDHALDLACSLSDPPIDLICSAIDGHSSVLEEQFDDFDAAEVGYDQAAARYTALYAADPDAQTRQWRNMFTLNLNRAVLMLRLGRHADARRYLNDAEALVQDDKQLADQIDLHLYRAYQAVMLGNFASAQQALAQAHEGFRQARRRQSLQKQAADAAFLRAIIERNASSALQSLTEAATIYATLQLPLAQALVAGEQARRLYTQAEYVPAQTALRHAEQLLYQAFPNPPAQRLRILAAIRAAADPDCSVEELEQVAQSVTPGDDLNLILPVFARLGASYRAQDRPESAQQTYRRAIEFVRHSRGLARLSPQHPDLIRLIRRPYEHLIELAGQHTPAEVYAAAEEMRVQLFLDDVALNRPTALSVATRADTHNPALQAVLSRLHVTREQLQRIRARATAFRPRNAVNSTRSALSEIDDALLQAQQAYDQAMQDYAAYAPALQALRAESYQETQQTLSAGGAILTYTLTGNADDRTQTVWASLLRAAGPPTVFPLCDQRTLDSLLKTWAEAQAILAQPQVDIAQFEEALEALSDDLASLKPDLAGLTELIIIPDDRLPLLPFHALPFGGSYLISHCTISYAPSATVLNFCRERERNRPFHAQSLVAGWHGDLEHRLTNLQGELRAVAAYLQTDARHDKLSLQDLAPDLPTAGIIHLGCHGDFPEQGIHPRFAYLDLGGEYLYAYDIYGLEINSALLTLSACNTAKVRVGFQGLVSAGLSAGASSVIAGLWEVDDQRTAQLMPVCYRHLLAGGLGRAEALRQAQLAMIADGASAYEWAPFILIGVPDPLPTSD